MIRFQLLGPLRLEHRGVVVEGPTAPKVRQLLALLLLKPNQVVSADLIVDELWGGQPPRRAIVTLQTYICHIRKLLAQGCGNDERVDRLLTTVSPGYVLSVEPGQLDLDRFRDLLDEGRAYYEGGEHREAALKLRSALELFHGPVLADVVVGQVLRPYKVLIEEEYGSARALRIQADLALGRHREIIGELKSLTVSEPLDEWAHARLMEALSSAGRRNEALSTYQRLHRTLDRELGITPSHELQLLQRSILTQGLHAS